MNSTQVCCWHVYPDVALLQERAAQAVVRAASQAIAARGTFHVVLAGGSTPRAVYESLRDIATDWAAWHVYFGDERCLPPQHPERNSAMAFAAWLDHVPLPRSQIHVIPAEKGAEAGAREYAQTLQGVGPFDLVLLGLGEDGHTASLFPGHDWGRAPDAPPVLAVHGAPKLPADRISLSAWRLSQTRQVMFLAASASKRHAVAAWQAGGDIPARAIRPDTEVDVLLDASCLDGGAE
ncbi:MAG: 6-phosphogluconolactonase [Pseudomonadota bacterium]